MEKIRIVSDEFSSTTKLMVGDIQIDGVQSVIIDEILIDSQLTATIKVNLGGLGYDIEEK